MCNCVNCAVVFAPVDCVGFSTLIEPFMLLALCGDAGSEFGENVAAEKRPERTVSVWCSIGKLNRTKADKRWR